MVDGLEGDERHCCWPVYQLGQLGDACDAAKAANKYLFIWDKQGSVGTFMQYQGMLASMGPEIVKVALGQQDNAAVGEFVRKSFVNGMRQGAKLCIDLENAKPTWNAFESEGTYSNQFWDWEWMSQETNYLPLVREDERYGIDGVVTGHFARMPNFQCIVRSGVTSEEDAMEVYNNIPFFTTSFHHVIIE